MRFQAQAPVRIDFLGGGSDCPPFSTDFTGSVLNAGITRYVKATVILNENNGVSIVSKDLNVTTEAPDINSFSDQTPLDLLVGCLKRSPLQTNFSLIVESDLPPQSGLGASGAVGVATLAVLHYACGIELSPAELAYLAFIVERKDLGYPGGSQDQYGAAFGGFNYLTFHDPIVHVEQLAGKFSTDLPQLRQSIITELEERLLLIYTGTPHFSPNIHADIHAAYHQTNSPTKHAMHQLKQLADKGRQVLLAGDLEQFAHLLTQNWHWHKQLHPSCTSQELEKVYEVALQNGALGGKTCGAGGGGCVIFLCEDNGTEKVYQALQLLKIKELQRLNFAFDLQGIRVWQGDSHME